MNKFKSAKNANFDFEFSNNKAFKRNRTLSADELNDSHSSGKMEPIEKAQKPKILEV